MVKTLEEIIRKAESLSEAEQEAIAAIIQVEIEDEDAWQQRFSETPATLTLIAERAKRQYEAGKYGDLD